MLLNINDHNKNTEGSTGQPWPEGQGHTGEGEDVSWDSCMVRFKLLVPTSRVQGCDVSKFLSTCVNLFYFCHSRYPDRYEVISLCDIDLHFRDD